MQRSAQRPEGLRSLENVLNEASGKAFNSRITHLVAATGVHKAALRVSDRRSLRGRCGNRCGNNHGGHFRKQVSKTEPGKRSQKHSPQAARTAAKTAVSLNCIFCGRVVLVVKRVKRVAEQGRRELITWC